MRSLMEHHGDCGCAVADVWVGATPEAVGVYLWGRDVTRHVVDDGETPYYLRTSDLDTLVAVLRAYPATQLRAVVPLAISRTARHAVDGWTLAQLETVLLGTVGHPHLLRGDAPWCWVRYAPDADEEDEADG